MKPPDLRSEIELEKVAIGKALSDIERACTEIAVPGLSPTIIVGAASYIAQCYGGIEAILKRIVKNKGYVLPSGGDWHVELLKMFKKETGNKIGFLDEKLFSELSLMRKFRHVVIHGYGFTLDRELITLALNDTPPVVRKFISDLDSFLKSMSDA